MKTSSLELLSLIVLACFGFSCVGCGGDDAPEDAAVAKTFSLQETDQEEEPLYKGDGPRGGDMIKLGDDVETEVHFAEDVELVTVYIDGLGDVSKVEMITTIDGEETVYPLERSETMVGPVYGLLDAKLADALRMSEDEVQTEVRITTADGVLSGTYAYPPANE